MIKTLTALAGLILLGSSVLALPGLAANEVLPLQKADRLDVRSPAPGCAAELWPAISASCLRGKAAGGWAEARLVTARR